MGKTLDNGLTSQQLAFVERYLIHFNARRACTEAGYSEESYAYELIRKPNVKKVIEERTKAESEARIGLKNRVIEELTHIAFASIADAGTIGPHGVDIKHESEIPDGTKRAIQEFTTRVDKDNYTSRIKFHNKVSALEMLGKHVGLFIAPEVEVNIKPYIIKRRNGDEIELGMRKHESDD